MGLNRKMRRSQMKDKVDFSINPYLEICKGCSGKGECDYNEDGILQTCRQCEGLSKVPNMNGDHIITLLQICKKQALI